ncbi:MAG: ribonuclease HII [Bacteroidales bacterium]|jgi:ribonuclease HII|nr:ribonuclease HII [Bacteroidales bacterium]
MLENTYKNYKIVAGCDEAGRGCLAGPVFASAVILPIGCKIDTLNDSKKLTEKQRYKLRDIIQEVAIDFSVAMVDNDEIDKINILNASFLAMHRALDGLKSNPEFILIDGNRFNKYKDINHECIIKGDGKFSCIAAASILAKTYRDDFMNYIDKEHPNYFWKKNKGYPTKKHADAILQYGFTEYHRKSFNVPGQTKLF